MCKGSWKVLSGGEPIFMFLVSESVCGDSVSISMSYWIFSVVEGCDKACVTGVVVVDVTLSTHTPTPEEYLSVRMILCTCLTLHFLGHAL